MHRKPHVPKLNDVDCQSYRPGHHIHWIQALHTANKPEISAKSWTGRILEFAADGLTVEKPDGTSVRFLNHHMDRLVALSGGLGSSVVVNDQYAILRCGSCCFSVAVDEGQRLATCIAERPPANPTDEQRAQLVETHGGFSAPVIEAGGRDALA
jgi:hypothetical protein